MVKNWFLKETKIIRCHIEKYPNLNIYRTSRNEGMHLIVRDIINPQLSLAIIIIRLFVTVARIYRDLLDSKHENRI
jgi:hypothetical protein